MICGRCPYMCARQSRAAAGTSAGRHHSGAFSSAARSGPICSRARWVLGLLSAKGPTRAAGRSIGSRKRTAAIRRWIGSCENASNASNAKISKHAGLLHVSNSYLVPRLTSRFRLHTIVVTCVDNPRAKIGWYYYDRRGEKPRAFVRRLQNDRLWTVFL
jgi:hypothetical protein